MIITILTAASRKEKYYPLVIDTVDYPIILAFMDYGRCHRTAVVIFVLICCWAFSRFSCRRARIEHAAPIAFKSEGRLSVIKKNGRDTVITIAIEIADREEERIQGLMNRYFLPDTGGMLFVFEAPRQLSFWMKDTYLPLDIIFIDDNQNIIEIRENMAPLNTMPIWSRSPARYALEVNAWFCRQRGIKEGDKICWSRNR